MDAGVSRRAWRRPLVAAALGLGVALAAAMPAGAALTDLKPAVIASVDGPRDLTLRTARGGTLPVRLGAIDGPVTGECGASDSTKVLARLSKKYGGRVYFQIALAQRARVRGADGRYLAQVMYRLRKGRDGLPRYGDLLEQRLLDLGWGQLGAPATAAEAERDADAELAEGMDWGDVASRPDRGGLWNVCGGWLHAPLGGVSAASTAAWAIDRNGVTGSIGPLALPAALTPGAALTVGRVRDAAGGFDITDSRDGCVGTNPSLQVGLMAVRSAESTPCDELPVFAFFSIGSRSVDGGRGVHTGAPASTLVGPFDAVTSAAVRKATEEHSLVWLGPGGYSPWAWQTGVEVDDTGQITRFVTSVTTSPARPGE